MYVDFKIKAKGETLAKNRLIFQNWLVDIGYDPKLGGPHKNEIEQISIDELFESGFDITQEIPDSQQNNRAEYEIAEKVGLSTTPCWRRIQALERSGLIRRRVALLDRKKMNVGVTVFVRLNTSQHNHDWLEAFAKAVASIEEVVEFYRMSGDVDYLLKIVVPDIESYDAVYKRLIKTADLSGVSSSFAMEEIKHTTAIPVNYAT